MQLKLLASLDQADFDEFTSFLREHADLRKQLASCQESLSYSKSRTWVWKPEPSSSLEVTMGTDEYFHAGIRPQATEVVPEFVGFMTHSSLNVIKRVGAEIDWRERRLRYNRHGKITEAVIWSPAEASWLKRFRSQVPLQPSFVTGAVLNWIEDDSEGALNEFHNLLVNFSERGVWSSQIQKWLEYQRNEHKNENDADRRIPVEPHRVCEFRTRCAVVGVKVEAHVGPVFTL